MRWTGDGAGTWILHAAIAVLVPPVARYLIGGGSGTVALASLAMLAAFIARERFDERRKQREGTWTDQWRRDRAGDLLGPATAAACYLTAWGLL